MPVSRPTCNKCVYYRVRPAPTLFRSSELRASAVLKAQLEWSQENQQRQRLELERYESGEEFDYEPHFYPWCAAATPRNFDLLAAIEEKPRADVEALRARAGKIVEESWARLERARAGDSEVLQSLGEAGSAVLDPVSGDINPIYVLCSRLNARGDCPLFQLREG